MIILSLKTKEKPDFYFLSVDFLTVMAHILLASNSSARIIEFIQFLETRGIVLDSSLDRQDITNLINTLQEMGMFVKMSDDISAQFVYPLYKIRRDDS